MKSDIMIFKWKIVILGDPSVGKTSLVRHFCDEYFRENYLSTIGVSFLRKELSIQDYKVTLQLWDIGGQSIFGGKLRENYLRGAHGALILFDLTEKSTLMHLPEWYENLISTTSEIPIILIGNKCDLPYKEKIVSRAERLAKKYGAPLYITSAKTGKNMIEVFYTLTKKVMKKAEVEIADFDVQKEMKNDPVMKLKEEK